MSNFVVCILSLSNVYYQMQLLFPWFFLGDGEKPARTVWQRMWTAHAIWWSLTFKISFTALLFDRINVIVRLSFFFKLINPAIYWLRLHCRMHMRSKYREGIVFTSLHLYDTYLSRVNFEVKIMITHVWFTFLFFFDEFSMSTAVWGKTFE